MGGVTLAVYGVVPTDDKFNTMKSIYDMWQSSGVTVPPEVWEFFGDDSPDDAGMVVWLNGDDNNHAVTEWGNDYQSGFEIDISKLDPKFKIIRVANSW